MEENTARSGSFRQSDEASYISGLVMGYKSALRRDDSGGYQPARDAFTQLVMISSNRKSAYFLS